MSIGGLDLVVIAVLAVSVLVGCMRGFMYEAAMLFGWVVAFFVARAFAPDLAALLVNAIGNEGWRMGVAFVLIFIAVLFTNGILAFALKALFSKPALRPVDRLLGSVFGILRACVLVLVMTLLVHILHLQQESWWVQSRAASWLDNAMEVSKPFLRSVLNFDNSDQPVIPGLAESI